MKNVNMNPDAKLSFLERFAYGIGDYAGNLVYSAISAFLLVYYTNVIGASAAAAASIIAISKFLDGISDLAMGYIVDHTHSKWGKARPWIARLCIPLAVCTVLMFSVPSAFAGKVQIAYMFLTYNLVSTIFYTGINVPYATMQGLMTMNQYERGLLGNFRNLLATAGTMTINTVVLKMTGFFGGGDAYTQKGWTMTFVVLMIVFIVLNMFMFFVCQERVHEESAEGGQNQVSFIKGLEGLFKNKYWLLMVVSLFAMYFMMSCFFGSAVYFTMYNMGNAASSFCMKVGSGVGTAALGWILAAGGFDAQLKVQSASALSSISIAFAWVPVITSVICVICMAFFNVDKYYAKVVEDLSQGKHRGE